MTDDLTPELPWGEAQWEKFMRESDVRSARYGELLETLIDHPDRDEIIAREMGWDRDDDKDDEVSRAFDDDLIAAMNQEPTEEDVDRVRGHRDELERVPAYAEAMAWGSKLFRLLKDCESGNEVVDELLGEAVGEGHCVAAKIAGGHGMGYDDDSICGHIVNLKRSLEAADNSLRALKELHDRLPEKADGIAALIDEGKRVRQRVEDRIAELRSRVWWE